MGLSQNKIEMIPNGDFSQYTNYDIPISVWKSKFNDAYWDPINRDLYFKDIYGYQWFGRHSQIGGVVGWLKYTNSVFLLNSWYPFRSSNKIILDSMIYQDTFYFFNHNQYENTDTPFISYWRTFSESAHATKLRVCGKNLYQMATPLRFATKKGGYYHLNLDLMYDKNVYLYTLIFKRRIQSAFVDFNKEFPFLEHPKEFEDPWEAGKFVLLQRCNITLDTNLFSRNNNLKITLMNQYFTDSTGSIAGAKEQDVWSMPLFPEVFEEKHFSHLFKANNQMSWLQLRQKPKDSIRYYANDTLPLPNNSDSLLKIINYNGIYATIKNRAGMQYRFHPFLGHWKWLKQWQYPGKYQRYADKALRNADYFLDNLSLQPDMYRNGKIAAPTILCKPDTFLAFIPSGEKAIWRDLITGAVLSVADTCWIHLNDTVSIEVKGASVADTLNYSVHKPRNPFAQNTYRLCLGDSLVFSAPNGYQATWQNSTVSKNFVYHYIDNNEVIRASLTSNLGCTFLFETKVVKGPDVNHFQIDTLLCSKQNFEWSIPSKTWELIPIQNVAQYQETIAIKTDVDFKGNIQFIETISGCKINLISNIISREYPQLGNDIDTLICLKDELKLNLPKTEWVEINGIPAITQPVIQTNGQHLVVAGNDRCMDTLNVSISRFPEIQIQYNQLNPWTCFLDSTLVFEASPNHYQYYWQGSANASNKYETQDSSSLHLLVIDSHGCQKPYLIKPQYSCYKPVWIPNVFTPNADGNHLNETFYPHCISCNTLFMRIFSRWGECIYEGSEPWNGIYMNKPVPDGVYSYIIGVKVTFGSKSEIQYFKGDVQVMR